MRVKDSSINIQPIIPPHSLEPVTEEELARRKRQYNRLLDLGIDPTLVTEGNEKEDPFVLQALILINQDKEVPPELAQKVREYTKKQQTQKG